MKYQAHSTAVIDEGANIGPGTKIWHFSHISSGSHVGSNVTIGQNVYISSNAVVGDNVKIQNNVSVYDNVILEESVFCGPSCVFTNVINPRSHIIRKHEYLTTRVCQGATLGANCTIICGRTIGEYAFVGAGAVVTKDIPPYALVTGVPAVQIGWVSASGTQLDLPLIGTGVAVCEQSGVKYRLENNYVFPFE